MTGARATNYGTRIDYILGSVDLVNQYFTGCEIMPEVTGSDHCPVRATLNCNVISSSRCPRLCTKYLPEFAGKQQKLLTYLAKSSNKPSSTGCTVERASSATNAQEEVKIAPSTDMPSLKRSSSSQSSTAKKLKNDDKRPSGGKQCTLLGFFSKKTVATDSVSVRSNSQTMCGVTESSVVNDAVLKSVCDYSMKHNEKKDNVKIVNTWKDLLKGPPPAPLCKGHQVPCVLRTVKKNDSLNKGRQFWVCQKPDGEKNNPEARCDHFEWVDKRAKKK